MNRAGFTDFLQETFQGILEINRTKGHDYSGDDDAFANFKRNGELLNLDPTKVWGVYFMKHIDAIQTYIREGEVQSEAIEGRIDDAVLYLLLLRGMLQEKSRPDVPSHILQLMSEVEEEYGQCVGPKGSMKNHFVQDSRNNQRWELTDKGWVPQ